MNKKIIKGFIIGGSILCILVAMLVVGFFMYFFGNHVQLETLEGFKISEGSSSVCTTYLLEGKTLQIKQFDCGEETIETIELTAQEYKELITIMKEYTYGHKKSKDSKMDGGWNFNIKIKMNGDIFTSTNADRDFVNSICKVWK